jgi:hypothetical protein
MSAHNQAVAALESLEAGVDHLRGPDGAAYANHRNQVMTVRLIVAESRAMTSEPIRDPLADHLITPQNSLFVFIDYQPEQLATVRSMDHDLLVKTPCPRSGL